MRCGWFSWSRFGNLEHSRRSMRVELFDDRMRLSHRQEVFVNLKQTARSRQGGRVGSGLSRCRWLKREQNWMRNCFTRTTVGGRDVRQEFAQWIPSALEHPQIRVVSSDWSDDQVRQEVNGGTASDGGIGSLFSCYSWCLLRFSVHGVGAEHVETVVGQACERVRLHSNRLRFPRKACCNQEWWQSGEGPSDT